MKLAVKDYFLGQTDIPVKAGVQIDCFIKGRGTLALKLIVVSRLAGIYYEFFFEDT